MSNAVRVYARNDGSDTERLQTAIDQASATGDNRLSKAVWLCSEGPWLLDRPLEIGHDATSSGCSLMAQPGSMAMIEAGPEFADGEPMIRVHTATRHHQSGCGQPYVLGDGLILNGNYKAAWAIDIVHGWFYGSRVGNLGIVACRGALRWRYPLATSMENVSVWASGPIRVGQANGFLAENIRFGESRARSEGDEGLLNISDSHRASFRNIVFEGINLREPFDRPLEDYPCVRVARSASVTIDAYFEACSVAWPIVVQDSLAVDVSGAWVWNGSKWAPRSPRALVQVRDTDPTRPSRCITVSNVVSRMPSGEPDSAILWSLANVAAEVTNSTWIERNEAQPVHHREPLPEESS